MIWKIIPVVLRRTRVVLEVNQMPTRELGEKGEGEGGEKDFKPSEAVSGSF